MSDFILVHEFSISFDYQGHRMALVKEFSNNVKSYFDCILFRDNILRVHFDGRHWLESSTRENTAIASALGTGIEKVLKDRK